MTATGGEKRFTLIGGAAAKPTPRPWHVESRRWLVAGPTYPRAPDQWLSIASFMDRDVNADVAFANAQYAATACSMHDDLVAAIGLLLGRVHATGINTDPVQQELAVLARLHAQAQRQA